jgi:hypothetical protein
MDKWEYRMIMVNDDGHFRDAEASGKPSHITDLGMEGWEITHAWSQHLGAGMQGLGPNYVILRKPIKEPRRTGQVL